MRQAMIVVLICMVSCNPRLKNQEIVSEAKLTFQIQTLEKEACVGENCAKLKLEWPLAFGSEAAIKINLAIEDQMSFLVQTGENPAPLDSAVAAYLNSFEAFKKEFPDSFGAWEIESKAEVSYVSDSTLSIYFTQYSFLGGAHPNSLVSFLNFDPKTGEALSVERLVLDESGLLALAESKFRKYHEVREGISLVDSGQFFLPETGFFLPNAMGFKDGKFWVIYVPYEIGSYVLGYTELEFTKEELGQMIRW